MLFQNQSISGHSIRIIYILSIIVSNSPQLFLVKSQQSHKFSFILFIFGHSSVFFHLVIILNLLLLIWIFIRLLYLKKYSLWIQLWRYLLSYIVTYFSLRELRQSIRLEHQSNIIFNVINLTATIIVLLIISFKFSVPPYSQSFKTIRHISLDYPVINVFCLVTISTISIAGIDYHVGLGIIFCINLAKSIIVLTKLSYDTVFFQYCSILNEITAWVSLIVLSLRFGFDIDGSVILWANSILVGYLIAKKSRYLIIIAERKYLKAIYGLKDYIQSTQTNKPPMQEKNLIEIFVCLFDWIEERNNSGISHIRMSQSFKLVICQLLDQLTSSTFSARLASRSKQSLEPYIQYQQVWQLIQTFSQLKIPSYQKLRNFFINKFPIFSSSNKYKLMLLYYLNHNNSQKNQGLQKLFSEISYRQLTRNIFFGYKHSRKWEKWEGNHGKEKESKIVKMTIGLGQYHEKMKDTSFKKAKNFPRQIQKNMDFEDCCHQDFGNSKLSKFDLYYTQTLLQDSIQGYFQKTFRNQSNILTSLKKQEVKHQIFPLFLQKSTFKLELKSQIQSLSSVHMLKSLLYKFTFQFYINNTPQIAINNFKMSNFEDLLYDNIKIEEKFDRKISKSLVSVNLNCLNKLVKKQDTMVCVVSGCHNFGGIYNCCENFKNKIQVRNRISTIQACSRFDKLSIYDVMLPIWVEKHSQSMQNTNYFDKPGCHSGSKVHMLSLIEKNIYEVDFSVHYIVRNTEDLLLGLEIKLRSIDKICIQKGDRKIFQSIKYDASNSLKTNFKLKIEKLNLEESCFVEQNCIKSIEKIFGQEYTIFRTYKNNEQTLQNKKLNKSKHEPSLEVPSLSMNPQKCQISSQTAPSIQIGQTQCVNIQGNQKLQSQIKMMYYSENTFLFWNKLINFTVMHWQIPPMILFSCIFLRFWVIAQQSTNLNLFETKLKLQRHFLLIDTHLLNNLYYLDQLHQNMDESSFLNDSIVDILLEDIQLQTKTIEKRQLYVTEALVQNRELLDFAFHKPEQNDQAQSFYYSSLRYDVQLEEYLKIIGLANRTRTQLQGIKSILNSEIGNLNIKRFFQRFKHRYEEYFMKDLFHAVSKRLSQYEMQTFEASKNFFNVALNLILYVNMIPAIIFLFIYVDLKYNVQKVVFECMNLGKKDIRKIQSKLIQVQQILKNCKQHYPTKVLAKYQKLNLFNSDQVFPSDSKTNCYTINLSNEKYKDKKIIYDTRVETLRKAIPQILIFLLIGVVLQILLGMLIPNLTKQIQLIESFSKATGKIGEICALSNEISTEILYARTDKSRDEYLMSKIDEYWRADKIQILQAIVHNKQAYEHLTFTQICSLDFGDNLSICSDYNIIINLSYAEAVSSSTKQFSIIKNHFSRQQTFPLSQIDDHMNKINKRLSIVNRFTSKVLELGLMNYQKIKGSPQMYFNLVIVELMFIIVLFNWFGYCQLYLKLKIYYREVFSLIPVENMENNSIFSYYLNQSKKIPIFDIKMKAQ